MPSRRMPACLQLPKAARLGCFHLTQHTDALIGKLWVTGVCMSFESGKALFCLDLDSEPVTGRKDDAPAAVQAAIANVVGLGWSSGGGGLIQTTFG
jgi:hypothetical protein